MLVSSLDPTAAWAAPAPCSLVDQETPRIGAAPALSVMVMPLSSKTSSARPVCNVSTVKNVGMASCFGVARGRMVSVSLVSLVSPASTSAALNATLRARFGRLVDGAAK
jgi:hypothetical protein